MLHEYYQMSCFWKKKILFDTKRSSFNNFLQAPNIAKMSEIALTFFRHFLLVTFPKHHIMLWRMRGMVMYLSLLNIVDEFSPRLGIADKE